ncbi:MAG: class II fructose-bisphosphate aldolase [Planctomycetota bacterium]|nr:MAG: class II fructose-bisphosphate aldolase [Planctomycetota bacterium]REJ90062.1 MAG: class II fructose-bisphosphate aldolase [Planctomycetota bacterium]REK23142.1 MAG: class II fructose-bisphosphate aldolase [Planctomycetota bacterium]REK43417.1 MAG: class II fructose-bisphosphate aldolase [Planctomycetota bacterium]
MPIATPQQYRDMLDAAQSGHYAYPAINVTSMTTANAALKGFADKKSDGIIQVSTGGAAFASGLAVNDQPLGAISIAEHLHRVADRYDVLIALHTDHCQPKVVDSFMVPLIEESERRFAAGEPTLFNSHMLDASNLPLEENLDLSVPLYERLAKLGMMLEIEAGIVGGEEDGAAGSEDTPAEKLYTTPEDMVEVYRRMNPIDGTYMFAATFGNVHGSYKPGAVKLRPEILKQGQDAIKAEFGADARFHLVFHGGSGSEKSQIKETLQYGVVKMNVDTDTQYAFTRPIVDHVLRNYDEVLKVEGEVGNKKKYDPRSYLKLAEAAMAARVGEACDDLEATGKSLLAAAVAV